VDSDRARQLLVAERIRIEQAISGLGRGGPEEASDRKEPGDEDSEDLYQDEFDADQAQDLHRQLAAIERAEARLANGTYGLSVESGKPIPLERLDAAPTAERTVEEEERRGRY
jgi:DnaK suppressor protein